MRASPPHAKGAGAMEDSPAQPVFTVGDDRLTLLETGADRLRALLELIGAARTSLRLIFYIYADDRSGREVLDALVAAAGRGVSVHLVVDGFGSDAPGRFFRPLVDAGGCLCRFAPRWGRRYLLRNHQKLALADSEGPGARAITGGFNVEDDYFDRNPRGNWRDLGLLVEGPAAARLGGYYDSLEAAIRHPRPKLRHLNRALSRWSEREGPLRWLIGGPTRRLSPWARTMRADMRRARRIDLVAGYFTPSPSILRRLDRAGLRAQGPGGRGVRIVTAARSDNDTTIAAARFTYAGLLRKGVSIFEYQPAKLHTKLYAVDDAVYVGSANFDVRSLFINLELMLRVEDAAFAEHVRGYIDGEVARSEAITEEAYKRRTGPVARVRQFLAYLLVGVVDPGVTRGLNLGPGS